VKKLIGVMAVMFMSAAIVYAGCNCSKHSGPNIGTETADTVTGTTESAIKGTATVVEASVNNTAAAPLTAAQAAKDTANKAFSGTDSLIKTLTGDKE